jgi:hypothetical protein
MRTRFLGHFSTHCRTLFQVTLSKREQMKTV